MSPSTDARPPRPTVSQSPTGGASPGDPRSAERRGRETLAERNAEWRGLKSLAERNKSATKAVGIKGRSRPTLQHASLALPKTMKQPCGTAQALQVRPFDRKFRRRLIPAKYVPPVGGTRRARLRQRPRRWPPAPCMHLP